MTKWKCHRLTRDQSFSLLARLNHNDLLLQTLQHTFLCQMDIEKNLSTGPISSGFHLLLYNMYARSEFTVRCDDLSELNYLLT